LGNLDETAKVRSIAMMDALLLPSVDTTEAFGVVQIEAQLMSVPVIASRLPTGVTDVTLDNETGLLVPPRDPDALAEAVSRLIGDRDLAARLGRAGRAHALKNFTFEVFQRRFAQLFDIILAGQPIDGLVSSLTLPTRPDSRPRNDRRVAPIPDINSTR
jgi:rhamnosyl/mannosyltransferase